MQGVLKMPDGGALADLQYVFQTLVLPGHR